MDEALVDELVLLLVRPRASTVQAERYVVLFLLPGTLDGSAVGVLKQPTPLLLLVRPVPHGNASIPTPQS